MSTQRITPSIGVTIGQQTRLYHAFITTAPSELDARSTVTLYTGPLSDVIGMAAEPNALYSTRARTPLRLILVDTTELAWQKVRCHGRGHRLTAADPVLVGTNTLQPWLWQRLQVPRTSKCDCVRETTSRRSCANDNAFPSAALRNRNALRKEQHDDL